MEGVNKKQLAEAEKRALYWNGKTHISDVIPQITVERILIFSQKAFEELSSTGYKSLKKASRLIGYYSRRTDLLLNREQSNKENKRLSRNIRSLQHSALEDEALYFERSTRLNTTESSFRSSSPILNKLFELAVYGVMDQIMGLLKKENIIDKYITHHRLIDSWVRSIVRYPGNPGTLETLERIMAERIVLTNECRQGAISNSLALSSYLLSLMVTTKFEGKLSYARFLINTGKNSVLSKNDAAVFPQCSNHLGCNDLHKEIAIRFMSLADNLENPSQFHQLDVEGQNTAFFASQNDDLITIFGVDMDKNERLINCVRKMAFYMKDIEAILNESSAMKEANILVGLGILKNQHLLNTEKPVQINLTIK